MGRLMSKLLKKYWLKIRPSGLHLVFSDKLIGTAGEQPVSIIL